MRLSDERPLEPWLVCSPEYGEVVPVTDEGQGPMEYGCDVVFVEAETRRDALVLGVKAFRDMDAHYLGDQDNPFAGVKVKSMTCPAHGRPVWIRDHYECPQCEALMGEL